MFSNPFKTKKNMRLWWKPGDNKPPMSSLITFAMPHNIEVSQKSTQPMEICLSGPVSLQNIWKVYVTFWADKIAIVPKKLQTALPQLLEFLLWFWHDIDDSESESFECLKKHKKKSFIQIETIFSQSSSIWWSQKRHLNGRKMRKFHLEWEFNNLSVRENREFFNKMTKESVAV
jgi:hypothetical protein